MVSVFGSNHLEEEKAVGDIKFMVEQLLRYHLEDYKKLILMEECTTKQCYVKLNTLSPKRLYNIRQRPKNILPGKKKMPQKDRISTKSLDLTNPRIKRNADCITENFTKKNCGLDEISKDPRKVSTNYTSNKQCNNSLDDLTKNPVIIPFRKHKGNNICGNNFIYCQNSVKVHPEKGNEIYNVSNQNCTLDESINDKRNNYPTISSTLLSYGNFKNNKAKQGRMRKFLATKSKECWYVKS